ncbi:MAG: hypothetical protein D3919_15405 [Candidatus Electrothrix sp. AW5]|nr:hypothetical protein [Candidatus Electrothrix gigas]
MPKIIPKILVINAVFIPSSKYGIEASIFFTLNLASPIAIPVKVPKIPKDDNNEGTILTKFCSLFVKKNATARMKTIKIVAMKTTVT